MAIKRKYIQQPGLSELMQSLKRDIFKSMNCIKIGKIVSFDITLKTAKIQILFKRILPDKVVSYPLLLDCPVFTLQGGGGSIRMPIQAGDHCIVLFSDRNIDLWYSNGAESAPANLRCHDLSDGIALVGINYSESSLPNYNTDEAKFDYANARFALKGGKANIQNATKSLYQVLTDLINGIQGATFGGYPLVDVTGKISSSLIDLRALLYKD